MTLKIVHECQEGALGCIFQIVLSLTAIGIIGLSAWCLKKVYDIEKRFVFEIVPLTTSLVEALVYFIVSFFYLNFVLLLVGQYVQSLTFAIVTQSFAELYFRMQGPAKRSTLRVVRTGIISLVVAELGMFMYSMFTIGVEACNNWLRLDYFLPQAVNFSFTVLCIVFGLKLIHQIRLESGQSSFLVPSDAESDEKHYFVGNGTSGQHNGKNSLRQEHTSDGQSTQTTEIQSEEKEHLQNGDLAQQESNTSPFLQLNNNGMYLMSYYQSQKMQVRVVMWSFSVIWVLQVVCDILRVGVFKNDIICEVSFAIHTKNDISNFFFFVYTMLQVLPTMIIPYVFYYLPILKNNLVAQDSGIDIDQDYQQQDEEGAEAAYRPPRGDRPFKKAFARFNGPSNPDINRSDSLESSEEETFRRSIGASDMSFVYGPSGTNDRGNTTSMNSTASMIGQPHPQLQQQQQS